MSDEFSRFDDKRHSDGRDGRSPISELKIVKYNAFVDGDHITTATNSQGASFIRGELQLELFSIMKYELVFAWTLRDQWRTAQVGEETTLRVFSVLNGLGGAQETRMDLLMRIRCVGFAGTGTKEDSTNQAVSRDMPVVVGGLYNTWNTGDQVINAGDWVYWDLPKSHREIETMQAANYNKGRPRHRYLGILRPYNPQEQHMNVELLRAANVDNVPKAGADENGFMQWAQLHAKTLRQAMYLGALMAAFGVFGGMPARPVRRVPATRTDDQWIENMKIQMMQDADFQDFALEIAHDLNITQKGRPPNWIRTGDVADPMMIANRLLFPTSNADLIVPRSVNRTEMEERLEIQKIILGLQQSLAETNLRTGEEMRNFTKSRILGKAMQDVSPGDFFDILIGSYAI